MADDFMEKMHQNDRRLKRWIRAQHAAAFAIFLGLLVLVALLLPHPQGCRVDWSGEESGERC